MSQFFLNHESSDEECGVSPSKTLPPKVDACGPPGTPSVPGAAASTIVTPEPRGNGVHAGNSGDKPEAPQKRQAENQDVRVELFPADGSADAEKPTALDAEAGEEMKKPVACLKPNPKVRANKKIKLTPGDGEDKLPKPHGADKGQRAARGEALTFAGHRPPTDPELREQFLRIRKEYMDQKEAFKAEKKGKKKSDPVGNWTPYATQLQYLQFMKTEMAKLKETDATMQDKFTSASEAWKSHCIDKGYLNVMPVDDQDDVSAAEINSTDGAEMNKQRSEAVAEEANGAEMRKEHIDSSN